MQSSAASRKNTQRILASAVADAFFHGQLALAAIEIATANKEFYEQQLQDAESRLEVGSGSLSDVLNMKVQLNTARNSLLTSDSDYKVARYALAALLGLADSALPETVKLAELDKDFDISADNSWLPGLTGTSSLQRHYRHVLILLLWIGKSRLRNPVLSRPRLATGPQCSLSGR